MARARNIKPSLFKNEVLGVLDPMITLLFESLWCLADREGRLEDRPMRIKAETFPYRENLDINGYLTVLEHEGFIQRYTVDNVDYIQVINFTKHQSPHKTEKASVIPPPPEKTDSCQLTVIAPLKDEKKTEPLPPDSLIPDSLIPEGSLSTQVDQPPQREKIPFQEIIKLYHEILPELPQVAKLTETRKRHIRARWLDDIPTLDDWKWYFELVRESRFLMGRAAPSPGRKPFIANLDWLITESNAVKVAERRYHEEVAHGAQR